MQLNRKIKIKKGSKLLKAPCKIELVGGHYEIIIGIGKDHTASLIISRDALEALNNGEEIHISMEE